jgi:hypothetical protein
VLTAGLVRQPGHSRRLQHDEGRDDAGTDSMVVTSHPDRRPAFALRTAHHPGPSFFLLTGSSEAGLCGRSPATDRREKGFGDDADGGKSEEHCPVKKRLNDGGRGRGLCRGVVKAGHADRTIVMLASVIVMVESHCKD